MDEWRKLPVDSQMTYLVGLVVRSAVDLDAMTRHAHASVFNKDQSAGWDAVKPMSQRVNRILKKLPDSGLSSSEFDAVTMALESVLSTYEQRNRFVHDLLMLEKSPAGEWWSLGGLHRTPGEERPKSTRVDLAALEECERQLVRASWRAWGIHKLVTVVRSGGQNYERRKWLLLVQGNFDLDSRDNSISSKH